MICLSCKNNMNRETVDGVEVDVCPSCDGMWFDKGELTAMFANLDIEKKMKPTGIQSDVKCPRCPGPMQETICEGVSVDVCVGCSGIWLDGLELNELLLENELDRAAASVSSGKATDRETKKKKLKATRGMELVKRLYGK